MNKRRSTSGRRYGLLGLLLLMIATIQAQMPQLQWAVHSSSPLNNFISAMAVDSDGNTLFAITSSDDFNFAGVHIPFSTFLSGFAGGVTLIKLNVDGEVLWYRSLMGPWQSMVIAWGGLDTDDDNNVYVSYLASSNVENATPIGGMYALSTQARDHFLLKLSPEGEGLWYKVANISPGAWSTSAPICKIGPDGVYMIGDLSTSVNFDGIALSNTGLSSTYLVKHDLDGNVQWGDALSNTLGSSYFGDMVVGGDGSVYASGAWNGDSLHLGPLSVVNDLAFTGNRDRWICKFSTEGNPEWLRREHSADSEWLSKIAVTPEGELMVVSLNGAAPLYIGGTTIDGEGVVLSRYSDAGVPLGAALLGALQGSSVDLPPAICIAENDTYYILGTFIDPTYTFGGLVMNNAGGNTGTRDVFMAKMNAGGQAEWVYSIGGPDDELSRFVVSKGVNHLVVAGGHAGTGFNIQGVTLMPHTDFVYEAFIASFSTTLNTRAAKALQQLLAYPNPFSETVQFDSEALQAFGNAALVVFNTSGVEVYRKQLQGNDLGQISLGHLPKGAYVARLSDGKRSLHTKIVKH